MLTGSEIKPIVDMLVLAEKQGWLDRLKYALSAKHKILVLGSTGTGKTNFISSLSEAMPKAIDLMERTEFAQKHRLVVGKEPFVLIDTPGQVGHKAKRTEAIREALAGGIDGIINVVSYGYHEYRTNKGDAISANKQANQDFLKKHRQIEIDQLSEWTGLLGSRETAHWLITVVTKADLWWDRRDEALGHYETGDYFANLGDAKNLNPVVLPYSSVFHKFYGESPLSGLFDDSDRIRHRNHLFSQMLAAMGKSGG